MTFGKKTLFSILLGIQLLTNILELTHINILFTTILFSFCIYILLPGFLISLILRVKRLTIWENLFIIVGLSIAFLEFGGLLLNIVLPVFGIQNPLTFRKVIIGFNVYNLLLFIFAWIRTKQFLIQLPVRLPTFMKTGATKFARSDQFIKPGNINVHYEAIVNVETITSIQIPSPKRSKIGGVLYILPVFFPILAILGAIMINNGGSNILTLILIGSIACYCIFLVLLRDKIGLNLYPHAIFFISIAILFTTSLRSWYITGHDIEREFYVFQLANKHHFWSMAFYQDAYNACLSITILPTVLANLLAIPDMYVYKIVFQILFATSSVMVYFISKNYTAPVLAYLSSFFFISFPTFFNDMPMLNRQEIGFIFFGLLLYVMLLSELSLSMRRILFIIFGLSIIVSHYSTNFVTLALVTLVYVLTFIISRPIVRKLFTWLEPKSQTILKNTFPNKPFLSLPLILLLFLTTYIWNTTYTNSSNHTGSVIAEVVDSIFVKSNTDAKSSDLSYSIFSSSKIDPNQQLQDYIDSIVHSEKKPDSSGVNNQQFYSQAITSKYHTYSTTQEKLALTPLGTFLSSFHIPLFNIQAELRSLSAAFMQILVFFGLLAIFLFKRKTPIDLQYLILCLSAIFLLTLIIVIPALSTEYGLLRMFQQMLFMLSLLIVFGHNSIFVLLKEQKRVLLTGIIAVVFFLNLTGFISHLTGDYYPQMTLDNAGLYYDAYYVHKSDVLAIAWLSKNKVNNAPVEADLSGINKLLDFGDIVALNEAFPQVIQKSAYVYLEIASNTVVAIDKNVLVYNSPKSFLDNNKNTIYSNGKDNIYR